MYLFGVQQGLTIIKLAVFVIKTKLKMILLSLNLGIMDTVLYDNYVTARSLNGLAMSCAYAEINLRKQSLYSLIETHISSAETFNQILEFEGSNGYKGDKIAILLNEKIQKLDGIDAFLEIAMTYFYDSSDTRTSLEFLNDL